MRSVVFALTIPAVAAAALSGCAEGTPADSWDDFGYQGSGIAMDAAFTTGPPLSEACYSFEVTNGSGERVLARGSAQGDALSGDGGDGGPMGLSQSLSSPICAKQQGARSGALHLVLPCDPGRAPAGHEVHTVRMWVNAMCAHGSVEDGDCDAAGLTNPCGAEGCTVRATCVADRDVPVSFYFSASPPEPQGWIDLVLGFGSLDSSDACYSFELLDGGDPPERIVARGSARGWASAGENGDGGPVWQEGSSDSIQRPLCGSGHGSRGEISFVLPCAAAPDKAAHTLRYWVNAVCASGQVEDGDCVPAPDFVNPCGAEGCEAEVLCVENNDTGLTIELSL